MTSLEILAALDLDTLWWWVTVIPKVAVALGAVIFVHELGHFVVAKLCGVKCEKFMIGFDIGGYKLAKRWGETLYGIGILPLGGYVKMLGQDDDPAHIKEQMAKSQLDPTSADAVPITGPDGETYYVDRRSYLAKSVPQRMAIISAGVIMNIIFAFIFAVVAYGMGVPYTPSIVGETMAGGPAWQARLEPADEIVKIGNRTDPTFMQLMGGVTLGDLENGINLEVRRAASGKVERVSLMPKRKEGQVAMIGITSPLSLTLNDQQPTMDDSPAARAKLVSPDASQVKEGGASFRKGDTIVQVGSTPVAGQREFAEQLAARPDKPLQITIERSAKKSKDTQNAQGGEHQSTRLTFEVPAQTLRDFGLVMKMGPITAVQSKSPAEVAGLMAGDVIEKVDGKPPGDGSWTPDTLPDLMRQAAEQHRAVDIGVSREAKNGTDRESVNVKVTPRVPTMFYSAIPPGGPQGIEALGIAYQVTNQVQAVLANGPAANSGIKPGDKLTAAKVVFAKDKDGKTPAPLKLDLGDDAQNWVLLVDAVQFASPETFVEFKVRGEDEKDVREAKITPAPVNGVYHAPRGFVFQPVKRTRIAATFADQLRYGWDETTDALTMVVRFLRKLGGQIPLTMLGGPGTIAAAAGGAASQGISSLLIFLTMLSANLAVLNFLPIPLLDGGHFVFLAYEGIRGRPANEKFVIALHTAGFILIVGLMLFVIGLDIKRWIFT